MLPSGFVSVFKRSPGSHRHIRTSVTIGLVVLMVVLLSAFCPYRTGPAAAGGLERDAVPHSWR